MRLFELDVRVLDEFAEALGDADSLEIPYLGDFKDARREFERIYIERRLAETGGNVTRAAVLPMR